MRNLLHRSLSRGVNDEGGSSEGGSNEGPIDITNYLLNLYEKTQD